MEEMDKNLDTVTEIVEEVTEKLTFKQNCAAYGITAVFGVGVIATGYGIFKGGKKLYNTIKNGKKKSGTSEEDAIDVDYKHVSDENESE